MGALLNPYLNFRGTTREAMQRYQEVFGGDLTISTFAELHGSMDPSEDDLVMHSDLQGPDGIRFMAADVRSVVVASRGRAPNRQPEPSR